MCGLSRSDALAIDGIDLYVKLCSLPKLITYQAEKRGKLTEDS